MTKSSIKYVSLVLQYETGSVTVPRCAELSWSLRQRGKKINKMDSFSI